VDQHQFDAKNVQQHQNVMNVMMGGILMGLIVHHAMKHVSNVKMEQTQTVHLVNRIFILLEQLVEDVELQMIVLDVHKSNVLNVKQECIWV